MFKTGVRGTGGRPNRLHEAIRRTLAGRTRQAPGRGRRGRRPAPAETLGTLSENRRRLLDLYYQGMITAEGFKQEEERLAASIEAAREEASAEMSAEAARNDLELRFEQVATLLRDLDIDRIWASATEDERRVLIEELVESVTVFPDHLEVKVNGAPPLNVLYDEVGMKVSENVGVGDAIGRIAYRALAACRLKLLVSETRLSHLPTGDSGRGEAWVSRGKGGDRGPMRLRTVCRNSPMPPSCGRTPHSRDSRLPLSSPCCARSERPVQGQCPLR